jgi:hypothetical protein
MSVPSARCGQEMELIDLVRTTAKRISITLSNTSGD